jgi:hypothetical protein
MNRSSTTNKFPLAAVLLVLIVAFALRICALWLPHWRGDQGQYLILAMNLSRSGLEGYNLRKAQLGYIDFNADNENRISFSLAKGAEEDKPGTYVTMMKKIGQGYYDEPLHVRAPLLPAILALSHRLFVGSTLLGKPTDVPMFAVISYGPKKLSQVVATWRLWHHQLWAAAVPLGFNLGLIFLTALLAWALFASRRVTVLSAIILASNPLSIWLAHKILTEDAASFMITAAVLAFIGLRHRNRAAAGLLSGAFVGAAVLVNQKTGLILPAIGGFAAICIWREALPVSPSKKIKSIFSKARAVISSAFLWAYPIGFLAISGFWFWRVTQTYGHPLHQPIHAMTEAAGSDVTGWFAAVRTRPHAAILFSFGAIALCPLFVFCWAAWHRTWSGWFVSDDKVAAESKGLALLWVWVAVFFLYFAQLNSIFATGNQEHRYFYPAYPALAILSAFGLNSFTARLKQHFSRQGAWVEGIVVTFILISSAWSCSIAYPKIFADQMLF